MSEKDNIRFVPDEEAGKEQKLDKIRKKWYFNTNNPFPEDQAVEIALSVLDEFSKDPKDISFKKKFLDRGMPLSLVKSLRKRSEEFEEIYKLLQEIFYERVKVGALGNKLNPGFSKWILQVSDPSLLTPIEKHQIENDNKLTELEGKKIRIGFVEDDEDV